MSVVCAIDVGISNLSICILQTQNGIVSILHWGVVNLNTDNLNRATHAFAEYMLEYTPYVTMCDVVVIEDQSTANLDMKVMAHAIQVFFVTHAVTMQRTLPRIFFVEPKKKFSVYDGPPLNIKAKTTYRYNKKCAIEHAKYLLRDDKANLLFMMSLPKRDDAADSFLLGMYCVLKLDISRAIEIDNKYKVKPTSITTENTPFFVQQHRTCNHPLIHEYG